MTDPKQPHHVQELSEDAIIQALVPDPAKVPELQMLAGLLGRGTQEGYWRLYLTPDLGEYVEFAAEDLVHCKRIEATALERAIVWIKAGARLRHTRTTVAQAQGEFLKGDIASGYLGGLGPGGIQPAAGMATTTVTTSTVPCTVTVTVTAFTAVSWFAPRACSAVLPAGCPRPPGCPGAWTFCWATWF